MECIRINLQKRSKYKPDLFGTKRSGSSITYKEQRSNILKDYFSRGSEEDQTQGTEVMCDNTRSMSISYERFVSQRKPWNCSLENINNLDGREIGRNKLSSKGKKEIFLAESNLRQDVILNIQEHVFEVWARGTRFMKSIDFPTVIIKLREGNLRKSMIYSVIMRPETEEYTMAIPCLVFSCPYGHAKTKFAELLPLYFLKSDDCVTLSPMLRRKRFRRIFQRENSFKVQWLMTGRASDGSRGMQWKRYDVRDRQIRNLLQGFIGKDINEMYHYITKGKNPLTFLGKRHHVVPRCETRVQKDDSCGSSNSDQKEVPHETAGCSPSCFCENKKVSDIVIGGNHIEKTSKDLFPFMCKGKKERPDRRTKDSSISREQFGQLWCISGIM